MDWQAANIFLVSVLVCITAYYAWQVKKQTDQMEKNRRMERLQREMDDLISELHSRYSEHSDDLYFNNLPLVIGKDMPDYMDPKLFYAMHQFWTGIKKNLYLTPKATRDGIRKFLEFKLGERDIRFSPDTYADWKEKLRNAVDDRHKELTQELEEEIRTKHWWQFWR